MKPTQEQVIAWAREAGMMEVKLSAALEKMYLDQLQRGFTLAYEAGRKDENEECAKVCEEEICGCCWESEAYAVVEQLAAAIRARMNPLQRMNDAAESNGEEL